MIGEGKRIGELNVEALQEAKRLRLREIKRLGEDVALEYVNL